MDVLKKILYAIGALVALILIVAAIMPKDLNLESEVIIAKPKQVVFDYVKILDNQKYYSKWVMLDPNVKMSMTGTDGTVGAISAWKSSMDDVGVGEQEIKTIVDGERIEYELRFKKPFEATDSAYTTFEAIDSTHTKVINGFRSKMPFPMNLMMPMVRKMLTTDMAINMKNLNEQLSKD
ncbi:MAG: SRPBCC family protein [Sphingobacteriales bacterium]|nr:SRPBCC family protein [Sphingobacteriales bacterium]